MTDYEVVCKFIQAMANQDFDTAAGLLAPDAVFRQPNGIPHSGDWVGVEGLRAMGEKILAHYDYEVTSLEAFDAGERTLLEADTTFTSKRSGASVSMPLLESYRVENGLIKESRIFYHNIPALAALHEVQPA